MCSAIRVTPCGRRGALLPGSPGIWGSASLTSLALPPPRPARACESPGHTAPGAAVGATSTWEPPSRGRPSSNGRRARRTRPAGGGQPSLWSVSSRPGASHRSCTPAEQAAGAQPAGRGPWSFPSCWSAGAVRAVPAGGRGHSLNGHCRLSRAPTLRTPSLTGLTDGGSRVTSAPHDASPTGGDAGAGSLGAAPAFSPLPVLDGIVLR